MLFFLISCLSFIILSKSLSLKPLPPWASKLKLLSIWFWQEFSSFLVSWSRESKLTGSFFQSPASMPMNKRPASLKLEIVEETPEMSILDLPELALECILGKLPPSGLCRMAGVCRSLRDRCRSNHLWESHMKKKWGGVIDRAAYREWQWHIASMKDVSAPRKTKKKSLVMSLSCMCSIPWARSKYDKPRSSLPVDSIMSWYLALESGKFWFPAQVYNREHGHVGFMLSCYDAELSYDSRTDTFYARYPPHGRRTAVIEDGVQWDRIRAPPVDTPPHDLHVSDCLNDLHPGDHIEIQWRRNKEFPYGWWYGVVGHLESCDRNENHCLCSYSDTVVLEFNQYTHGSRWRQTTISRKDHREEGNEADGFYGGIRKLYCKEEISTWKRLWPKEVLE
ncbi:PREDICTED: F-box protein At2g32560-like [Nelumbo nucifera]|uniref:F-box protein At2g32560-like n=1 Tax=Nelumbo nucifera TaxID=4432 RepID=A0A1U8B787_NELNU|nr:PREDICTED: F-box protein At2g32560-like [Nelumbo nucifera]